MGQNAEAYKQKEEVWFDDGREERLLEFVKSRLTSNDPESVIKLIDEFGAKQNYMMNVGSEKGRIVTNLIAEHQPKIMIELGSYIGYSTVLFAAAVRDNGGEQYISFEREPKFQKVASEMIRLAGLSSIARIEVGPSSSSLVSAQESGLLKTVDMVFLDHYKPAYVKDLKILESLGVVKVGTVLAADNVISPGNPTYLEYVRSTPEQKRARLSGGTEGEGKEQFPDRTVNQYKKEYTADLTELPGVPGIVYESRLEESHEPTGERDGIEISICKSIP